MNTKLMLALWPESNLRYYGSYANCQSMWFEIRAIEEIEGKLDIDTYGSDGAQVRNVGLLTWCHQGYPATIELKGHDIHSASSKELSALARWLAKYERRIIKANIPNSFGVKEQLILTLRAMGITQAVRIKNDWNDPKRFETGSVEEFLDTTKNYAIRLNEMEALRVKPKEESLCTEFK